MATEIVYTSEDQYEYITDSEHSLESPENELELRVTELLTTPVKKEDRDAVSELIDHLIHDFKRGWHRHVIAETIAQNYVAKKKGHDVVHNRIMYICMPTRKRTWGEWFRGIKRSKRDILFTQAVLTPDRETLLREMLENRFAVFNSKFLPENSSEYFQWRIHVDRDDALFPIAIRVAVEW